MKILKDDIEKKIIEEYRKIVQELDGLINDCKKLFQDLDDLLNKF